MENNVYSFRTGNLISAEEHDQAVSVSETNDMLAVLSVMEKMIKSGEITSFVAVSTDGDSEFNIHATPMLGSAAIGILEIGKTIVLERNLYNDFD